MNAETLGFRIEDAVLDHYKITQETRSHYIAEKAWRYSQSYRRSLNELCERILQEIKEIQKKESLALPASLGYPDGSTDIVEGGVDPPVDIPG